ncbi:MAG: DNA (cytosine-5)-methyltransferase 1 [Brevundimonas sp.]|jgi:DNA (cytosine-5)-methyltransferase 1|uniref:DNA (cytosine-5-)-methyltransferase n=1 Tax=Brevundimonas sp. TaxID=1871086 RepID=UPI0039E6010F
MPNREPFSLYEFFAGGGLAGLGLDGFRTTFANDLDGAKAASWRANHADPEILKLADVWDLTPDDLPGRADLAWASSPCQDVSLAGARGGLDARRSGAFWGFWRLMTGLAEQGRAPGLIVIENVMGLLTSNHGRDFAAVCRALHDGGYVFGAVEADAALWLPQSRPRLFIIAARRPVESAGEGAEPFHSGRIRAAHDALPDDLKAAWVWWRLSAPPRRNTDLAALLQPDDAVDWLDEERAAALLDLLSPLHRARLDAAVATGERRVGAAYRRVRVENDQKVQRLEIRFDGLAGCLRTPAGGSSRQFVVVCDKGRTRVRRLTGREAARLMGLPDSYVLPASEVAALKLMGDAVAVPVVRALADQILRPLLDGAVRTAA